MRWIDRVYGDVSIDDPEVLAIIDTPTFQRLRGIRLAGPSAIAYPFKDVTRFEHSLGVYLLLLRLGAGPKEALAGLLHDLSHTAFSHAIDFLVTSDEQDYHEGLKHVFLDRPDMVAALAAAGHRPEEFYDDSVFPLLERPLPWLCADRLDYFFRDSIACKVTDPALVATFLDSLVVVGRTIAFDDPEVARVAVDRYAEMNRDWWASGTESFIYNEFADALRIALDLGAIERDDLLEDDAFVLDRLRSTRSPVVAAKLEAISRLAPDHLTGFVPRVVPKARWIDPPVRLGGELVRLSEIDARSAAG